MTMTYPYSARICRLTEIAFREYKRYQIAREAGDFDTSRRALLRWTFAVNRGGHNTLVV
jgi:hypothetical protein